MPAELSAGGARGVPAGESSIDRGGTVAAPKAVPVMRPEQVEAPVSTSPVAPTSAAPDGVSTPGPAVPATAMSGSVATAAPEAEPDAPVPEQESAGAGVEIAVSDTTDVGAPGAPRATGADASSLRHPAEPAVVRTPETTEPPRTGDAAIPRGLLHGAGIARSDDLLAQAELNRVTANGRRLDVGIATADLGNVRVEAIDRGTGLQLQLSSDQAGGRSQLGSHLAELRAELSDVGVDIGSLDVGDAPAERDDERDDVDETTQASDRRPESATTDRSTGAVRPARASDGLDLRL